MKKVTKKLTLNRETLVALSGAPIVGGLTNPTCATTCALFCRTGAWTNCTNCGLA